VIAAPSELPVHQQDRLLDLLLAILLVAEAKDWSRHRVDLAVGRWSREVAAPTDVITLVGAARGRDEAVSPRRAALLDQALHAGVAAVAERLVQEALTDSLTGLATRARLEEEVQRLVAAAARTGSPLTAVMVDIDGLKRINDEQGHHAGDEAIAEVGRAIREHIRQGDRAFRFGGDEFVVFLPGTTAEQARTVMQRVQRSCRTATSTGIAVHSGAAWDTDLTSWLQRADAEMYAAREAARAQQPRERDDASAVSRRHTRPSLAGAALVVLASTVASGVGWVGAAQVARTSGADEAPLQQPARPIPAADSPSPVPSTVPSTVPRVRPSAEPAGEPLPSTAPVVVEREAVQVPVAPPQPLRVSPPIGVPTAVPSALPVAEGPSGTRLDDVREELLDGRR